MIINPSVIILQLQHTVYVAGYRRNLKPSDGFTLINIIWCVDSVSFHRGHLRQQGAMVAQIQAPLKFIGNFSVSRIENEQRGIVKKIHGSSHPTGKGGNIGI